LNPDHRTLYYFAAAANGIQNGMTSTYSANLIRTTHLTGTSTDIGLIIGQMIRGNMKNLWKFKVLVGLATSFWLGSLLSFYSATAFLSNSLWFSAALYLLIGLTHITFVVLTQKVGFFQACFGTYKWKGVLESMAASMTESGDKSIALKAMTHSQIDHVFDEIDNDGSGTIDATELMQALNKMGMKLTRQNVEAMMRVVDDNGDGVIDREEFHTLVRMSTLRAEHKREKRERRKESVVKIKQSFIAGASVLSTKPPTMADLSMRSGKSSEDSVPDAEHSALPRTYDEALPKEGACDGRAIIVTETESPFRIVGVNKPWEDLCGYKAKEALQKSMSDLIQGPDTNRDGLKDAMNKLVHDGTTSVEVDTVNYRKDKSTFKNHLVMGPLYDESEDDDGIDVEKGSRKAAYYVGILTNIGELTQCLTMDKGEDGDFEEKMDDSFVENEA